MRLVHCLFAIFHGWIWLFILTSILGGTKAEVRCNPSCQLPLITAFPWEFSALELTNFDEAPVEDLFGFIEGSNAPSVGDEKRNVAKDQSSFTPQQRVGDNNVSLPQKDGLNGKTELSKSKVLSGNVLRPTSLLRDADLKDNSTYDGKNRSLDSEMLANVNVTATRDTDVPSWSRSRSTRSAETWPRFRAEGVEDASLSDQEEFQLTSSTFPLTGDTAHNQAMVHWSGQNSSVSG